VTALDTITAASVLSVVKVYFWGPGTLLKCGPPAFSGLPVLRDGPGWSYLRHGLFLAVYAEVVKGHTLGHFIFPLKLSFKLGFRPKFGLKPN